ncbi:MAG: pectinesterase family protein, partial [Nitrospiraceae bacterium]
MADDTHKKAGLTSSAMRLYFLSMSLIPHTFALTWMFWCSIAAVCLAQEGYSPSAPQPRTLVVALDGSGQYSSIQAAIDDAGKGDTVRIKAGAYREDVTIHSKERLRLVGEGIDKVSILGRERVGVFHIGKWPYGAEDIQISGLTIHEHGGHAMGMFNGR